MDERSDKARIEQEMSGGKRKVMVAERAFRAFTKVATDHVS